MTKRPFKSCPIWSHCAHQHKLAQFFLTRGILGGEAWRQVVPRPRVDGHGRLHPADPDRGQMGHRVPHRGQSYRGTRRGNQCDQIWQHTRVTIASNFVLSSPISCHTLRQALKGTTRVIQYLIKYVHNLTVIINLKVGQHTSVTIAAKFVLSGRDVSGNASPHFKMDSNPRTIKTGSLHMGRCEFGNQWTV